MNKTLKDLIKFVAFGFFSLAVLLTVIQILSSIH